jgi:hypothetical protein
MPQQDILLYQTLFSFIIFDLVGIWLNMKVAHNELFNPIKSEIELNGNQKIRIIQLHLGKLRWA